MTSLALCGCAGYQQYHAAQADLAQGRPEQGVAELREAMNADPSNLEYRRRYFAERDGQVDAILGDARRAAEQGAFDVARLRLASASRIDPESPRVAQARARVDVDEQHWRTVEAAAATSREDKPGSIDSAIERARGVLSEDPNFRPAVLLLRQLSRKQAVVSGREMGLYPKLHAAYRTPVSLSFSNASLVQVLESLKHASGLNYMLEHDVRPDIRVTLSVTDKPIEDVLRLVLTTNQLDRRVLDDNTVLIYPNTPTKQAEYREMVVRSFYLNHADAGKVAAVLKTITKARDVVVDETLNMIVVRDSEETVRLAEKVIAMQDLAEPEVMLELEVMEVSANRLLQMGIQWPSAGSMQVVGSAGVAGQLTLDEVRNPTSKLLNILVGNPLVSAQLTSTKTDANLLANPRVRVQNRRKAKVLIGERLPVITATTTANVGTSDTVSYLDVGLKLEIEPTVSLDDEVSMSIALEVSNVLGTTTTTSGTQAYTLGTRNTSTSLQAHDGETNILAGLIQRDQRNSNTGVPGLNEMPLLGKLFGEAQDGDNRTEIVLLITPHIMRNLDVPGVGLQELQAGTDSAVGAVPMQLGTPVGSAPSGVLRAGRPGASTTPSAAGPQSSPSPGPQPSTAPMLPPRPAFVPAQPAPPGTVTAPPALTTPPIVPDTPEHR